MMNVWLGSSLAVLPIDDCGRKSKTMPLLHAHSDTVTDMDFSNFHDGLLATGSQECKVCLWKINYSSFWIKPVVSVFSKIIKVYI